MPAEPERHPQEDRRTKRWRFLGKGEKTLHRVAAIVCSVLAIGGGLAAVGKVFFRDSDPGPSLAATELVLDASAGMAESFGGSSKLDVAKLHIQKVVGDRERDTYALRRYGGDSCDDPSELTAEFEPGNGKQIERAVGAVTPKGSSNLIRALNAASSDFNDATLVAEGGTRRLVVVLGTPDQCSSGTAELTALSRDLQARKIALDWKFVALAVPADQRRPLEAVASATGGDSYFVDTEAQLNDVLTQLVVVDPAIDELDSLIDYVNSTVEAINSTSSALNRDDRAEAEKSLAKARTEFEESETLYGGQLGAASQQERYRELYPLIKKQRRLQPELMSLLKKAIDVGKDERKTAVDELNAKFDKYNTGVAELSKQVDVVMEQLERQP